MANAGEERIMGGLDTARQIQAARGELGHARQNSAEIDRKRLESGEAWEDFCNSLRDTGRLILDAEQPDLPGVRAAGSRYLLGLVKTGVAQAGELSDRDRPKWLRIIDGFSKWGAENTDNHYIATHIRSDASYRITGAPEDEFGRAAFAAWFEAEGAAPTTSPALSGLRAAAVAARLGVEPAEVAFAVAESEADLLVLGLDEASRWIAVERKGELFAFDARGSKPTASNALDATLIQRVSAPGAATRVDVDVAADARAVDLARIAAAYEILGASRTLLSMAIQHSNEREQFGQPIAKFQAIQHLISECQIEISTLQTVCRAGLEEWSAGGGSDLARIAKAIAGRDGRAIAQRALQCFGAIGFTAEHRHHLYSRRIHTLDAVLGTYQGLRRGLGAEIVRTGKAPRGIQVWHP